MKITCPHCGLVGKIGEDKLKASSGSVRCPRCQKTFAPVRESSPTGGDTSPGERTAQKKGGAPKKDSVIFGARSGDDIPFTKIMEENELISDGDIVVELGKMDETDGLEKITEEEIISLGEEDIVSTGDMGSDLASLGIGDISVDVDEGTDLPEIPTDIPDLAFEETPPAPPDGTEKKTSRRLFGGGKKASAEVESAPAPKTAPKKAGVRRGFFLFFIIVLALWGGYQFFSTYWPPYATEKEFLSDSRTLFDKYHELRVYLKVGMPDPVFATKVAETAYVWEVYREKYESHYRNDPLYASLMIMGRLFLTIKELLDRDMYPDNYLGLEWGEGFPFLTKEEYVGAMVAGIPVCIMATEENFIFSKNMLDITGNLDFVSMTTSDILKRTDQPSRADYASDLKRANKAFTSLETEMPVLQEGVGDVISIVTGVSGK